MLEFALKNWRVIAVGILVLVVAGFFFFMRLQIEGLRTANEKLTSENSAFQQAQQQNLQTIELLKADKEKAVKVLQDDLKTTAANLNAIRKKQGEFKNAKDHDAPCAAVCNDFADFLRGTATAH